MKVLHVGKYYPPRWGGMETALKDICEVLARSIDVEALVAAAPGGPAGRSCVNGVHLRRLACRGTLFSQPLTPALPVAVARSGASLVHLHEPNPLAMLSLLAARVRVPVVIHYHSDIVRQRALLALYRHVLNRGLGRADAIIAGSHELVDSSPHLAPWRRKCVVIPFGIDLDPFLSLPGDRTAGQAGSGLPLILAVGRLAYYKGFHYLVEAMRHVPARLAIVGEGGERASLEALIARYGIGDRVTLAGEVSQAELVDWYRRADLFCLPSCERAEAFGLVQLEAMGASLPVVSTDLPTGMRAINVPGQTGLVVPPHDSPALAGALERLCGDAALRHRMGAAGRERARRHYRREVMGERILSLYASLTGAQSIDAMPAPAAAGIVRQTEEVAR